jgi:hypothetical protein
VRLTALLGIVAVVLFVGIAGYLSPLKPGVLELQFAFTPRAFGQVVHAWSPAHLARYRALLPLDTALLLVYGTFGYLLVTRTPTLASLSPLPLRLASLCLPVAAAFDAIENALHWWLTEAPRFGMPLVYAVSATCSSFKWALLLLFGLTVAYAQVKSEA